MDTKALIEKLNGIFCEDQKNGIRYSKVWLSEVDFGGLYENGMFILNVKAEHEIDSCSKEIKSIISLLDKKAKEELKFIWKVVVYNQHDDIHCESFELIVFDEDKRCLPAEQ